MQDHLEINEFGATFEQLAGDSEALQLAIHRLDVRLRRSGLDLLVKHLIPDVDVTVHPENPDGESGVDVVVQASQWGLRPRIRARVRLDGMTPGMVRIQIEAETRWSPLDWTMLRIVRDKLHEASVQRTELTREGPEAYRVDVHRLIGGLIAERGAPVRWDAWLSSVESIREDILLHFGESAVSHPVDG